MQIAMNDRIALNKLVNDNRHIKVELPKEVDGFIADIAEARKNSKTLMPLNKGYQRTGAVGEYVICRLFDQEMNTEIYHGKGDGGKDLTWRGYTIQVKATTMPRDRSGRNPYLIFFNGERLRCDIYFLVGVYGNNAIIYGWLDRESLAVGWRTIDGFKADKYNNDTRRKVVYMNDMNCNLHTNELRVKNRLKQVVFGEM